jgi:hypothetical protein
MLDIKNLYQILISSESNSDSNFTDVMSRALSTSQYKFHSNLHDKMKKNHGQPVTTSNHKFIKQSVTHSNVSRSLVFKWHERFSDGRGSLMDDKREGRPSFKTSDVVKNEVGDVIDGLT